MNIIALMGSPRINSNTDILTDEMIKAAKENGHDVKKYYVCDLDISGCRGCENCAGGNDCIIKDDAYRITHEIAESEGLIIATPIYYGQMTGQLKILIDRLYAITNNPFIRLSGKVAMIFTHLGPEGYYDSYIELTKIQPFQMNMHYQILDILDVGSLGSVYNQPDKIQEAYKIGKKF